MAEGEGPLARTPRSLSFCLQNAGGAGAALEDDSRVVAIETGNADAARTAMRKHLSEGRERYIELVKTAS